MTNEKKQGIYPALQVSYLVDLPHSFAGSETLYLNREQANQYLSDPRSALRYLLGGEYEDYLRWIERHGRAQCCATAASTGRQCQHDAVGCGQRGFQEWLATTNNLCAFHGGSNA